MSYYSRSHAVPIYDGGYPLNTWGTTLGKTLTENKRWKNGREKISL